MQEVRNIGHIKGNGLATIAYLTSHCKIAIAKITMKEFAMPTLQYEKYGPGKFDDNVDDYVYQLSLDGCNDEHTDKYGIFYSFINMEDDPIFIDYGDDNNRGIDGPYVAAILNEDNQGFVNVEYYENMDEAQEQWAKWLKE